MGAWIEIKKSPIFDLIATVAPRVGAWIEIKKIAKSFVISIVAPRVGAWIEICFSFCPSADKMSHPVWVRGLKFKITNTKHMLLTSHPVWVRGLKFDRYFLY